MRVSLIGATGNAGSRILAELAQRGHQVTAIVRHPERMPQLDGVIAKEYISETIDDPETIYDPEIMGCTWVSPGPFVAGTKMASKMNPCAWMRRRMPPATGARGYRNMTIP